jgi:hypothetical protein
LQVEHELVACALLCEIFSGASPLTFWFIQSV